MALHNTDLVHEWETLPNSSEGLRNQDRLNKCL